MTPWIRWELLAEAAVYSVLGAALFLALFVVIDKLTPGNVWREIHEKNNVAVAILFGSCAIALGLIISSAIRG